jgi:hypothetical protein
MIGVTARCPQGPGFAGEVGSRDVAAAGASLGSEAPPRYTAPTTSHGIVRSTSAAISHFCGR